MNARFSNLRARGEEQHTLRWSKDCAMCRERTKRLTFARTAHVLFVNPEPFQSLPRAWHSEGTHHAVIVPQKCDIKTQKKNPANKTNNDHCL